MLYFICSTLDSTINISELPDATENFDNAVLLPMDVAAAAVVVVAAATGLPN